MRYFRLNKLIRDKIFDLMQSKNQEIYGKRTLSTEEYADELKRKLLEESKEINKCVNKDELAQEIGDILEVIDHLKEAFGIDDNEIKQYRDEKSKEKGGFEDRIYVSIVGVRNEDPWLDYYLNNLDIFPEVDKPVK